MRRPGTVAVIGEEAVVRGFGLAGVRVLPAGEAAAVRAAWQGLPGDVALVILTPAAEAALAAEAAPDSRDGGDLLVVVLP